MISDDVEKQYEGTKELRSHLSKERNPPIQEVVEMRTDIQHMLTHTDFKLEVGRWPHKVAYFCGSSYTC